MNQVNEWLESEVGKSELLKFIDEMKSMSRKKPSDTHQLPVKSENFSADVANKSKNSTSYDELVLFDQILSAEINKTASNQSSSQSSTTKTTAPKERIGQTSKIISGNSQRSQHGWNVESQKSPKIENRFIKPPEKEAPTPKTFDAQRLIERIRNSPNGAHIAPNYELLSCKSQSFLQRLAVLGEMLT